MTEQLVIRGSGPDDLTAIEALYPQAFPDEDLLPLVRELLLEPALAISLVAVSEARVIGHVVFTLCDVEVDGCRAALLGPLAVSPRRQKQGVGSALVRAGLRRLARVDVKWVFVLGDPAYYSRFGFQPGTAVEAPYSLPSEWSDAWQAMSMEESSGSVKGRLIVPAAWRKPALWAP